ncbi:hypothetical protein Ocin01_01594 [Orchesella cincta]|uniref:Uncharacterized protein n=1 Tax=Orchesella cincta TaxID=48709 RepID=A0A1D2NIL1_ORCCI|nr:hypothetical protein Ocin01_01594 [Orchesella cincta]
MRHYANETPSFTVDNTESTVDYHENHEVGSDWMFHVDPILEAKIDFKRNKPRVAFLSSTERTYYPYDAGHSRLALENRFTFEDDLREPFLPAEDDRLQKPISNRGYGIGGLSAGRFPRQPLEKLPAPNQYRLKSTLSSGVRRFPSNVLVNLGLVDKSKKTKAQQRISQQLRSSIVEQGGSQGMVSLWDKCYQMNIGFGSSTAQSRFKREPRWNNVGPGHYNLREIKVEKVPVETVFMKSPAHLKPPTKLHCSYGPKDYCVECNKMLMLTFDYYRSKFKVPLPVNPIPITSTTSFYPKVAKLRRALLCRECYCKALRGESKYWKKKSQVEWLFEKTRHCGYIHEHNGLPEFTNKVSCNWLKRLTRKEAVLSTHWPDKCERRLKEKKYHKWD